MITVRLPWPPSVNHYWYRKRNGQLYIGEKGRTFREECVWLLKSKRAAFSEPVGISITFYPPDRRRRDSDNLLKALFDALEHGGAVENDSLIKEGFWKWGAVVPHGAVLVRLYPLSESIHTKCPV